MVCSFLTSYLGALYTNRWERWANEGWIDLFARDSHWTATVSAVGDGAFNWSANVPWPSGDNLPPNNYIIGVSAIDDAGNRTNVHRTFIVEEPAPTPALVLDAAIRGDAAQAWLGEGFTSWNAQGQTLTESIASGATQTRYIRIKRSGGDASQSVRVSVPDWAAFAAAGWSARFYDLPQGGSDITDQLTSENGWTTAMADGGERIIRVEATAPDVTQEATSALTLRVEADPSDGSALDVVKAVWNIAAPAPDAKPDLAIRANDAAAWLGEAVSNENGADQTLERVAKPGVSVQGEIKLTVADVAQGQRARWSVPDWDAFAADGWTARFFDVAQDDNEVTAQITGDGWTTTPVEGEEKTIRFEATAPDGASDVTRVLSVRAQVGEGAADVVRLSLRVPRDAQPDVAISRLDEESNADEWIGEDELSPQEQLLQPVFGKGETQLFAVKITNKSNAAAQFSLEQFALLAGWSWKLTDALEGGEPLEAGDEGWMTPEIAPYESLVCRLELTASDEATDEATLPLRFTGGSKYDECGIEVLVQKLAKLQWSSDGETWQDVTPATLPQIEQHATVGVRGVKSVPDAPWPDAQPMGPKWNWQGGAVEGETVWLQGKTYTGKAGETASATLGDSLPVKIRVLAESDVQLTVAKTELMAGSGPASLTTTAVSVRLVDSAGEPLAAQKVRLRALHEDETPAGTWAGDDAEPVVTTDAQGNASTTWTTDEVEGEVNFVATLLTDSGATRKFASHKTINVNAPYVTTELGEWNEDENGWSREVTVQTWYGASKLPGLGVALSAAVLDYETEQPVTGWQSAAPFDAATGVSDSSGKFTTIQRWNPLEDNAWPHDYEVAVNANIG